VNYWLAAPGEDLKNTHRRPAEGPQKTPNERPKTGAKEPGPNRANCLLSWLPAWPINAFRVGLRFLKLSGREANMQIHFWAGYL